MKFELEYKDIHFIIELSEEKNYIPFDRFERLSPQTLIALKKSELKAYSIIIEASLKNETLTFYLSNVLLTSDKEDLLSDLQEYLDHENVIEDICVSMENSFLNDGPAWKIK